jgi:hypothetical protein
MDIKQLVASLVSSLAWPGLVVVIAFLFREPLANLFKGLQVKRLKAGLLEVEFRHGLTRVAEIEQTPSSQAPQPAYAQDEQSKEFATEDSAVATGIDSEATGPAGSGDIPGVEPQADQAARHEPGIALAHERARDIDSVGAEQMQRETELPATIELADVVGVSPQAAVLAAYGRIERLLRQVLIDAGAEVPTAPGAVAMAMKASELGLIKSTTAFAIYEYGNMRNLAARGARDELSVEAAIDYLKLTDSLEGAIRRGNQW